MPYSLLTPRDKKLLVRYFDAVDSVMALRLQQGFSPHEDHLTSLLCELLDAEHAALHAVPYSFEALKGDLAADSAALDVSLRLETRKYPPHIERHLTSSDLGIVVEYRDYLTGTGSFERGCLLQAKRLYSKGTAYTVEDEFREFDVDQFARLQQLAMGARPGSAEGPLHHSGRSWCYYLMYCPTAAAYDDRSREIVRRLVLPNDNIFDYSKGWHLHEYASSPSRQIPGLVIADLGILSQVDNAPSTRGRGATRKPKARHIFDHFWNGAQPLSWFLVYDLMSGAAGTEEPSQLQIVRGQAPSREEPPALPRYVLTIRVQAGQG